MVYGSVCSGIEAATVAWEPLGWSCAFMAEIEKFPRAVLTHHYPEVPLHGDFTTIEAGQYADVDLLVGGTPCQSFSAAGKRGGLADARGGLAFEFLRLAGLLRPRWVVFENVPGLLSSNGGRDFGAFLGRLAELGYGWSYRVLDAQYFGVPQRRRRVFVVGCAGGRWQRAAAVLFEPESMCGDPAKNKGQGAATAAPSVPDSASHRKQIGAQDPAYALAASPSSFRSHGSQQQNYALAFDALNQTTSHCSSTLSKRDWHLNALAITGSVRRLMPLEWERLQGFPDEYTRIAWRGRAPEECPDTPRFKAIGNSMAIPVMRWIGERLQAVEHLT